MRGGAGRILGLLLAALRAARGAPALAALVGALGGYLWGISDDPVYATSATVLIADRPGSDVPGAFEAGDEGAVARLVELAQSDEVAREAALGLGDRAPGADLLASVAVSRGPAPGTLTIEAQSELPDYAAAVADAWSEALAEVADTRERRRLDRAIDGLQQRRDELLDPLSPDAVALTERISEIEHLAAQGEPVEVGRRAELPEEPISDRPALAWAAGGGLAGLLVATLLVLIGAARAGAPVRDPTTLAQVLGAPRLGAVPGEAVPQLDRSTIRLDRQALAANRALARELGTGREAQSLMVASARGGDGRTTIAAGLAAVAAIGGARVLLLEADLRRPALAGLLGLEEAPGLAEYLIGEASPREVLHTLWVREPDGALAGGALVCVVAGRRIGEARAELHGGQFAELVGRLRRAYDLVVIDSAPLLGAPEVVAIAAAADSTLVCAAAGRTSIRHLARAAKLLGPVTDVTGGVLVDR